MSPWLRFLLLCLLLVALVFALRAGWRALAAARRSLRLLRALRRVRRSRFDSLAAGTVALRGRAVAIDPQLSPETQRQGIYLSYAADRWERSATIGGLSGQWMRADEDEVAAPFELTDGKTAVLVDPQGGSFRAPALTKEIVEPGGTLVRYRETLIEDGADLLVYGQASLDEGFEPSSAYRGHTLRMVVRDAPAAPLTVASTEGLAASLAGEALLRAAGVLPAVLLLVISVAFAGNTIAARRAALAATPELRSEDAPAWYRTPPRRACAPRGKRAWSARAASGECYRPFIERERKRRPWPHHRWQ